MLVFLRLSTMNDMSDTQTAPLEPANKRFKATQCARFDAIVDARAIDFTANEPSLFEDFEVLGYG